MVVVVRPATRASCTELKSGTVVCSSGIVDGGGGKSYPPFFEQAASIAPARNISSTTAADRRIVSWKPAQSTNERERFDASRGRPTVPCQRDISGRIDGSAHVTEGNGRPSLQ